MLTILAVPRGFVGSHAAIQRRALDSWTRCGPRVEVLLFGDEPGIRAVADEVGARWIGGVRTARSGRPCLDDVFLRAQQLASHPLLCYVNADILLRPSFVDAVHTVMDQRPRFLAVARRHELQLHHEEILALTDEELHARAEHIGQLAPPDAIDVFAFPRGLVRAMPPFVIGRPGWDNWMIYQARRSGVPVIDITPTAVVVHLDTAPGYAQGKQPIHDGESDHNRRLAGWASLFTVAEATDRLVDGDLVPVRRRPSRHTLRVTAALSPGVRAIVRPIRTLLAASRGGAAPDPFVSPPWRPDG